MDKNSSFLKKILVVGVIVLFIGIGMQPAIANNVSITKTSYSEEECDICPKASKKHIERLINMLDRIEKYDYQLSEFSKINPELEDKYQELSKRITIFDEMNEELKKVVSGDSITVFCDLLGFITGVLLIPFILYTISFYGNDNYPILKSVLLPFILFISILGFTGFILYWTICLEGPML